MRPSAAASTVWDEAPSRIVQEPSAERGKHVVVPDTHHSLLPLPGTHRGPRLLDVARHLHHSTGMSQRSVSGISVPDCGYYWGFSADGAHVCSALSQFVLLIGPDKPYTITSPLPLAPPLPAALVEPPPSTLVHCLLCPYDGPLRGFAGCHFHWTSTSKGNDRSSSTPPR